MIKANSSPLHCIQEGCNAIPTIVLEFRQMGGGMQTLLQIITCTEHTQKGIDLGRETYPKNNISTYSYPDWLQRLHNDVLKRRSMEGGFVPATDIERLRAFRRPIHRVSAER